MVVFTTSHIGRNARTKKVIASVMTNIRRTNADRLLNNWNCFDMRHVIISFKFQFSDGRPAALEELDIKELKQLRFRLLVEAGKIKQRVFDLTGEELP